MLRDARARTQPFQQFLFEGAGLVPIDNVDELPSVLIELELELPLFVNDQLGRRVENSAALILVGIVYFDLARSQVERSGLGVVISFTESEQSVGNKANLASCWSGNQANETEVVANCAGDGNTADGLHLGKRIYQPFVLALREGLNEDLSVLLFRVLVNGHFHTDHFTQLRAGAHCGGVDGLYFSVIRGKSDGDRRQE